MTPPTDYLPIRAAPEIHDLEAARMDVRPCALRLALQDILLLKYPPPKRDLLRGVPIL
jgi:hypothetical protein